MEDPVVIFITASSEEEAKSIGDNLVEERLAACVNIVSGLRSLFVWKGEVCDEEEVFLMVKSRRKLIEKIVARVREIHSYEVPEVIALPVVGGSEDYFQWMEELLL